MLLPISSLNYLKTVNWFRSQYTLKGKHVHLTKDSLVELYKDKHFLIVNKPFDLIVYDFKKTNRSNLTLFHLLKEKYPFYYDPVCIKILINK
jgi:hypothetical protein